MPQPKQPKQRKKLEAQDVHSFTDVQPVWKEGNIVGLVMQVEVNFGETSLVYPADVWEDLTEGEKKSAEALFKRIRQLLEQQFLGV